MNAQGSEEKIEEALEVLAQASIRDPKNVQVNLHHQNYLFPISKPNQC